MRREFYRVTEFAEVAGLSRAMAYRLVTEGKIPSVKIGADASGKGGVIRIRTADLEAWVADQTGRELQPA